MPRSGLSTEQVVAAAADLCDEVGFGELSMGLLAQRLNVRGPSLYKHVESLADLQHRVATLAMAQLDDVIRDALAGRSGADALGGLLGAVRDYVVAHPGRYAATVGARFAGRDDPLFTASARVLDSIAALLRGYGIAADESDHAIRVMRCTIHGYASLLAADGFQWDADVDESFAWMVAFIDRGLRGSSSDARA